MTWKKRWKVNQVGKLIELMLKFENIHCKTNENFSCFKRNMQLKFRNKWEGKWGEIRKIPPRIAGLRSQISLISPQRLCSASRCIKFQAACNKFPLLPQCNRSMLQRIPSFLFFMCGGTQSTREMLFGGIDVVGGRCGRCYGGSRCSSSICMDL